MYFKLACLVAAVAMGYEPVAAQEVKYAHPSLQRAAAYIPKIEEAEKRAAEALKAYCPLLSPGEKSEAQTFALLHALNDFTVAVDDAFRNLDLALGELLETPEDISIVDIFDKIEARANAFDALIQEFNACGLEEPI